MKYIPYQKLGTAPNIIVDGAGNDYTVLNLSHWPHSGTPKELKDDLSIQIVFKYLEQNDSHINVDAVSNNHFDEDGLVSMFAILKPEDALKQKSLLIDIGRTGDFGTFKSRQAAQIVFILSAYADPELSPFDPVIFTKPSPEIDAYLYEHMLSLLPDILNNHERFKRLWQYEEELLRTSELAIWGGEIKIEEYPHIDLAVVRLPEALPERRVHRFTLERNAACHPMALHNSLNSYRVLLIQGQSYELQYRYETWVQYMSKKLLPRVDLTPLALQLTKEETNATWKFDGVNTITPKLQLVGSEESKILPDNFVEKVKRFLETAPPAWDPYDK